MEYDKAILERTGIFVFRNAVSSALCEETITAFYNSPNEHQKGRVGSGYNANIKNTTDWHIHSETTNSKFFSILNIAFAKVCEVHTQLYEYPITWSGFQFQKNEKDKGYFKWHSDSDLGNKESSRIIAPIFYLNTVEEGGHTEFKHKTKIKPEQGTLIIFPCSWEYYHRGNRPLSNNKYIITAFGMLRH